MVSNDLSLVVVLEFGDRKFLFRGDKLMKRMEMLLME